MLKKFPTRTTLSQSQEPYVTETKTPRDIEEGESVDYTIIRHDSTTHLGSMVPRDSDIEIIVYPDLDHAGDYMDRKSINGVCTFMGCCLTSWLSKKQTALAISTTEAEYVSAGKACQQAL
ncbi:copia protein [Tanacetum coccineum]